MALCSLLLSCLVRPATADFEFRAGDRVVLLGPMPTGQSSSPLPDESPYHANVVRYAAAIKSIAATREAIFEPFAMPPMRPGTTVAIRRLMPHARPVPERSTAATGYREA